MTDDEKHKQELSWRCRIHGHKMSGEGWHTTASVLWAAADTLAGVTHPVDPPQMPESHVQAFAERAMQHLDEIAGMLKPDAIMTLIARFPDKPEQDIMITADNLLDIMRLVARRHIAGETMIGTGVKDF